MQKKQNIPNNIHDKVFRELMSNRRFAVEFLKKYLPKKILTIVDLNSLELINASSKIINEKSHKESQSDMVYSVKTQENDALWFWCHIEHQTRAEKFMPLRIAHYQCGELLKYAKLNKCDQLPPIITLIYHQGKAPYCFSLDLYSLFTHPQLAEYYFTKPILIDLPTIADETLLANSVIGPAEMVLKYIRVRKFGQKYQKIIQEMSALDDKTRHVLIYYLLERADVSTSLIVKALYDHLPQDEDIIMTSGEQLRQEGRLQGMQQGMQQEKYLITKNLLNTQVISLEKISEVTGLTLTEIKKIQAELEFV